MIYQWRPYLCISSFVVFSFLALAGCHQLTVHSEPLPRLSDSPFKDRTQQVLYLTSWTHSLAKHDSDREPATNQPEELIALAHAGNTFRCVEYSRVLAASLCANGIRARVLKLKRADAATAEWGAGHVVVEAYLDDIKGWVVLDPQFNAVISAEDRVASVIDLFNARDTLGRFHSLSPLESSSVGDYWRWLRSYLFYIQVPSAPDTFGGPVSGTIMFVPPGALPLKRFQRTIQLQDVTYTSDASLLYRLDGSGDELTHCNVTARSQ